MTIETKGDVWETIRKWLFHREKTDLGEDKKIDRVTSPDILNFFRCELRDGKKMFSQLSCEYCGDQLALQDVGNHFDLWCMNYQCLESEMHRIYKEDL